MKYAATIGMFDGVHRGHLCLIGQVEAAARARGLWSMAVTMDRHPRTVLTGERMPLLTTHDERMALLRQTGIGRVEVVPFTRETAAMTAREFMERVLRPLGVETLVMGYDHRFGHDGRGATVGDFVRWGREAGIEVVPARELDEGGVSSSAVRRALRVGDMGAVERMLGRPYTVTGTVVEGRQVGRELGFPTANLRVDDSKMLPGDGVYATLLDGRRAMTSIGRRPTVDNDERTTVETHVLGFSGDLYGQRPTLAFVRKIRDIVRFDSREALVGQLRKDAAEILANE